MNVFVTGATGYIGSAIVSRLRAEGHRVFGTARNRLKAKHLEDSGITPVVCSLEEPGPMADAARQADAVIHARWNSPRVPAAWMSPWSHS